MNSLVTCQAWFNLSVALIYSCMVGLGLIELLACWEIYKFGPLLVLSLLSQKVVHVHAYFSLWIPCTSVIL